MLVWLHPIVTVVCVLEIWSYEALRKQAWEVLGNVGRFESLLGPKTAYSPNIGAFLNVLIPQEVRFKCVMFVRSCFWDPCSW